MRQACGFALATLAAAAVGLVVPAAAQTRNRPIRVGNLNVLLGGVAVQSFDHPNFDAAVAPNLSYMRRVLRRELRIIPVWLRAGLNYHSENRDTRNAYTVWPANRPAGTFVVREDSLAERTSDFAIRAEILSDLLHRPYAALYAGGGFAVHTLSFSTRGCAPRTGLCSSNTFKTTESRLAPSAAAGMRVFTPRQPYTAYVEVRYARAFGKTDFTPPPEPFLTENTFAFTSVNQVSIEGGIGLHW